MPQFQMKDKENPNFNSLPDFEQGYFEAMFFTEEENLGDHGFLDLDEASLLEEIKECELFQQENRELLEEAYDYWRYDDKREPYIEEQAGRDFWFTRNGHGAGFWDRGLGDVGDRLSELCGFGTKFQEKYLEVGDDGKIYVY